MSNEATDKGWLSSLAAGLKRPGELGALAQEVTASYLLRCPAAQAAALKADLIAEKAEITQTLMRPQAASATGAVTRRQEIVDGALRAFKASAKP
jgi:hypothetical protein